ncbi:MAG: TPM domain-containing protein [Chitinophagales bacterium]|nr:TPM domain-containing protein [Chitinophagales bacterium]
MCGTLQPKLRLWSVLPLVCFISGLIAQIPERPNPPRLVNDFAGMLSPHEVEMLETKLVAYNDSTTTQIAIVTIPSLNGAEIGSFAAELGEKWGVGTKKNHNGIILLVSRDDRKVTIRTGYGVEERLGAVTCSRIIQNTIIPNFKEGNIYGGLNSAVDEIILRLEGLYRADENATDEVNDVQIPAWVIVFIIIIIVIVILSPFLPGDSGGRTYTGRGYKQTRGGWYFPSGGSFGGGGSRGGFGGFGGGSFSGGGASGSW